MHIGPVCVCVYHADMISLRHSPPLFLSPSLSSRLLCPLPCSLPLASSLQGLGCFFPPSCLLCLAKPSTLHANPTRSPLPPFRNCRMWLGLRQRGRKNRLRHRRTPTRKAEL